MLPMSATRSTPGSDVVRLRRGVAMDSLYALIVAAVFTVFLDLKSRREEYWLRYRTRTTPGLTPPRNERRRPVTFTDGRRRSLTAGRDC